jgi:transposase-like protein
MQCPFCEHQRVHKHGKTAKGVDRFKCPACGHTFTTTFDTIYYRRQVSQAEVHQILQSHQEGVSLRGLTRISGRSTETVSQIIQRASEKAQMVHNQEVTEIDNEQVAADELWSFVKKNKRTVSQKRN